MGKQKLDLKQISVIDFPSDVAKSLALNIMNRHFKHTPNEDKLKLINDVLKQPDAYVNHNTLSLLAHKLVAKATIEEYFTAYELTDEPKHFDVFGSKHIEINAIKQMEMAMRLPIAMK